MKDEEARRLKGQIIVITGASEGIGRATALALAKEGASLVLAASNNVGRGLRKPFLETTEEDWNQLVATNLSSVLYGCRAVLPSMEQRRKGLIINIASRSGRVGEANLAAYSAVKHGVIGLTRALAEEEGAKGIHVNAICPGSVRTERMERLLPHVDKSSWLSPEDVAATIAFLACSAGYTMQGQSVDMY